jgi:hypothetical protein
MRGRNLAKIQSEFPIKDVGNDTTVVGIGKDEFRKTKKAALGTEPPLE